MNASPVVVVSGMVAATPWQGGATWAVLQYLLGLRRLGYDVFFIEHVERANLERSANARYCRDVMRRFGFDGRWSLVHPNGQETAGISRAELRDLARRADVLINISGLLADPEILDQVATRVYVDLDPAFTQLWHCIEGMDMRFDAHTHFATVADNVGGNESIVPTCGRTWIPTLPPVVLDQWSASEPIVHDALTTVAHWRGYGSIEHGGVRYGQKVHALRPLLTLPTLTSERFKLALAIHPEERRDLEQLRDNRWELVDPAVVAGTPHDYRRFVERSKAEFGLTKTGYVVSDSGWFSDRSACYLASGRPVVAQDTGFGRRLPTGWGLLPFTNADDVLAAVDHLRHDYVRHRAAAREIARGYLDSDRVLGDLLSQVGL